MYGTPTFCHTLDSIFLTTKMVLKNNVETLSTDKMACKFSLHVSSFECLHTCGFCYFSIYSREKEAVSPIPSLPLFWN